MKKRILFIEPSGSEANVFDNYMKLPLLGSLYLGTILYNAGYDVKIINENISQRKISPLEIDSDIVCISCLTITANRTKELAEGIKFFFPNIRIIIGGIHASLLPEEFKDVADNIVIGEAEDIIIDIIEKKCTEKFIYGNQIANLDELPLINYSLIENYKKMNIIPIMTSRGCPFNCNFCTVTKIFGKKFRKQSVDRIISEIKNALTFFYLPYIFFYDDNFTADKNMANELIDRLIAEKLNLTWTAQVRADIAKDEILLSKMFKAGCERFYIGFESIDDSVLQSLNKAQTKNSIINSIKIIHNYGINIHGMFMLGEDHDTLENISNTAKFAIEHDIDTVQFMILTPFPGTETYEKINSEKRLLHKNWSFYDGMHIVFTPKNMTSLQLQKSAITAYKEFYSFNRTMLEFLRLGFEICFDALVWDFKQVSRYDLNNIYLKTGAKFIISEFMNLNKPYINYLEKI